MEKRHVSTRFNTFQQHCAVLIMGLFDSAPVEIIVRILGSCNDFQQLLSLTPTCKRLHSVWTSNAGTIIWEVGRRDILCFDDALMAVSDASPEAPQVSQHPIY